MTTWVSAWGRRKAKPPEPVAAQPSVPAAPFHSFSPHSADAVPLDGTPLSHRIGLALDQACQGSGLKQWKWLKQMDIPARAFAGWKTGSIALSLKSLERLLPAIGWTLTITDPHGQVIVTSGPTPPDAS